MLRVGAGDTRLTRAGKIPLLIGTTGKKYSGKDTAADYIAKNTILLNTRYRNR